MNENTNCSILISVPGKMSPTVIMSGLIAIVVRPN
jgi:hypothetical protein